MRSHWRWFFSSIIFLLQFFSASTAIFSYDDSGTISIQGTVPPKADAYVVSIDADRAYTVSQDTVITYTLSYTSNDGAATPLTLQAEWYKGTIDGAPTASVDLVNYEINSATKAYGETAPVVDLVNHTITWSIASLPAGVGTQTVSFALKTTDNYTGSKIVTFPVNSRITVPLSIADQSIQRVYTYRQSESTGGTTSTPSPSPQSAQIAFPSEQSLHPSLTSFSIIGINESEAKLGFLSSSPAHLVLQYGTSSSALLNSLTEEEISDRHVFNLKNLESKKKYYFRVFLIENNDRIPLSEVFTFETASSNEIVTSVPLMLSASQFWGISYSMSSSESEEFPSIVAIVDSTLDIHFAIPNSSVIESATLIVRSPNVLGVSTESDDFQSKTVRATEVGNSMFVGKVRLPKEGGNYDIILRTEDIYGNIEENKLASVVVIKSMRIFDSKHHPISGAQVLVSRYNEKLKTYDVLPNTASTIKNPIVSDESGYVTLSLLSGRYKAKISLNGFVTQEVEFTIDPADQKDLPQITLKGEKFTPSSFVSMQFHTFFESNKKMAEQFRELTKTYHFEMFLVGISGLFFFLLLSVAILDYFYPSTIVPTIKRARNIKLILFFVVARILALFVNFFIFTTLMFLSMMWGSYTRYTALLALFVLADFVLWAYIRYRRRFQF